MSGPYTPLERSTIDFEPVDRLLFGAGRLQEIGQVAQKLGCKRTLLVTDPGIIGAGHVDVALIALRQVEIEPVLFDQVEENPTTEHVARALDVARKHHIDSIIGIGGGSSMDCAKGVNFLYTNGGKMEDYWGVGRASKPMLPSIGVPTTAGTGSETQSFALISDSNSHQKMACGDKKAAFRAVILDADVTESMPGDVRASTGIDAISHALESFVTRPRNPVSQAFSRESWRLLAGHFESAMSDSGDQYSRAGMLLGASLAGLAIEHSMLGAAHSLANPLTARYGIVHGVAIGLMLPHVVRYNGTECRDDYGELARIVSADAAVDSVDSVARLVERFRERAGLPSSLRDVGVDEASLSELAREAASQWTAQFNPKPVTVTEMEDLYRCAL